MGVHVGQRGSQDDAVRAHPADEVMQFAPDVRGPVQARMDQQFVALFPARAQGAVLHPDDVADARRFVPARVVVDQDNRV
jgi:hypothetical protein